MESNETVEKSLIEEDMQLDWQDVELINKVPIVHYHNICEIAFFIKANIKMFINDRQYLISDGDIIFAGENEIHKILYHSNTRYTRYVINFRKEYIQEVIDALKIGDILGRFKDDQDRRIHTSLKQRSEIMKYFDRSKRIYEELGYVENSNITAELKIQFISLLMYIEKIRSNEDRSISYKKTDILIKDIIRFIDDNYKDDISLDILEKMFHLSRYHMVHMFKRITGLTIIDYLQQRRIMEACKKLRETDRRIIEICLGCGFNNTQHFCRVFKKIIGMTAFEYRKKSS